MSSYKNIKILTWFNFFTDFKLYSPIAIIYFTSVTNSFALGMSIFSIAMISSAVFEIPTGVFSDMIGRRKTVMLGALASVVCVIFYAIGQSYWILAVGAVFEGLSRSFYSGNNDALLYDSLAEVNKKDDYHKFLGKISSMFQIALALSAIAGGIIAGFSFALMMWLSVIPQAVCFVLSTMVVEPAIQKEKHGNIYAHLKGSFTNFIKNARLRNLSIADILSSGLGETSFQFQSAFYNTVWPLWAIGLAKTLSYFGASISFLFSEKIINRLGNITSILFGNIYSRAINIVATGFPSVLSPALMSSTSLLYGVTVVAKKTLLQREFTDKQRATMSSLNSLFGSLFYGVSALGIGLIADKIGPAKSFLLLQFISLPVIWLYLKIFKEDRQNRT